MRPVASCAARTHGSAANSASTKKSRGKSRTALLEFTSLNTPRHCLFIFCSFYIAQDWKRSLRDADIHQRLLRGLQSRRRPTPIRRPTARRPPPHSDEAAFSAKQGCVSRAKRRES